MFSKTVSKTLSNRLLWILLPLLLLPLAWKLADWALFSAVFQADLPACQQAVGQGACWGVVAEKWRLVLFGRYPLEEQWRAGSVALVLTLLLFVTAARLLTARWLVLAWALLLPSAWLLMAGGSFGGALMLEPVPTSLWGGLPLTLIISTVGFGLAFPLALLLALGRRSRIGPLSWICMMYIEVLRALPLVAVLFLAAFVVPLWLPAGDMTETLDLLARVLLTIALFSAAYLAEVLRGGLQAVPQGQHMAALALGLDPVQSHVQVVLPQAIRA